MSEKDSEKFQYQQWEYKQLSESYVKAHAHPFLDAHLASLGKEGWEAYAVVYDGHDRTHYFKRPIIVERPSGAERARKMVAGV
ncbi:hypothetical protein WME75_14060 [Sorangium sp. So ce1014]|uniref:hypothetical protein n=1 Tax=Sorangium sp. So ce1014 TaxID=3133326 RepID=UPI003F5EC512